MSATGTPWAELQTAGLVGTDRRPWRPPAADEPLGAALAGLPDTPPAKAWLGAAGVLAVYRLAGQPAANLPPVSLLPCPPETLPPCPSAAAQRLGQMLAGQYAGALPEWLAAAAAGGWRVPAECLPALLRLGQAEPGLRAGIRAVIGQRGAWLAAELPPAEFPAASYAAPPLDFGGTGDVPAAAKPLWETGTRSQRLALLHQLRQQSPAKALDVLRSTWKQDKAEDRASFVSALAENLGPADEDYLEAALDDHAKEVWRAAASLLARLPGSRLGQRMAARVTPLIQFRGSKKRAGLFDTKAYLEVALPETCDAAAIRDGLVAAPPKGVGQRAWWLEQMIGATPLAVWPEQLGAEPKRLIQLALNSEEATTLLAGWARAAQAQADSAWIKALLWHTVEQDAVADKRLSAMAQGLCLALPSPEREALLSDILRANPNLQAGHATRQLLPMHPGGWGPPLSRLVLDQLIPYMRSLPAFEANDRDSAWLKELSYHLHPALLDEGRQRLGAAAEHQPQWVPAVDQALAAWQFRREMLKELTR